jgi:Recombinase zinc beta ribbon domain
MPTKCLRADVRTLNYGRPRTHPLAGLIYCGTCQRPMVRFITRNQGRGYGCRKDENPDCAARPRIAAEPLEEYVAGYVIDQWRNPHARTIAQSDSDRMARIAEITDEMSALQDQLDEALEMKLGREVDLQTYKRVTSKIEDQRNYRKCCTAQRCSVKTPKSNS